MNNTSQRLPGSRRSLLYASAGLAAAALAGPAVAAQAPLAERLLAAVGGRERWAGVHALANLSQQNRIDEPTVVQALVRIDFTRQRLRIDTTAPGLALVRVVDGEQHWRRNRSGQIEPVPAATLAEDRRWYAGHVYRSLHRLAREELQPRVGRDARIELVQGSTRVAWFATDSRGEPYAFGAHDDEVGSICGPWDFERDGLRHPVWVARPDGSWRAALRELEVNPVWPPDLFARP